MSKAKVFSFTILVIKFKTSEDENQTSRLSPAINADSDNCMSHCYRVSTHALELRYFKKNIPISN